ncbi:MAG: bifunctional phosphoglucose/phosphomannose isomerase, partial [Candidatus Eremiobacterota bacterium]
ICKGLHVQNIKCSNISIFGMGGSGTGGELVNSLVDDKINIPLMFFHHYHVPNFISSDSLCLLVSYSGNTEEILHVYDTVKSRKAHMIIYASGGLLLEKAIKDNIEYVKIPSGYQPRCALAFLFLPLLYTLYCLSLIPDPGKDIEKSIEMLKNLREKYGRHIESEKNYAKEFAGKLTGTIPLIYSSRSYLEPVAKRWKNQLNENAKTMAFCDNFPELCHNTICAWDKTEDNYSLILLRSREEDSSVKTRAEFLKALAAKRIATVEEIKIDSESFLEEILSVIYLGDFVSIYLALLKGADPVDISLIRQLKETLAKAKF